MKSALFKGIALMGSAMLAGCGPSADAFIPGAWEIEGWMEVDGRAGRLEHRTHNVRLSQNMAGLEPRGVAFSKFYNAQDPSNVVFADGVISGHLDQGAVAPFAAHEQAIEGWYKPDAFEMRITMPTIAGIQSYQVVSGKLVEPLG